jgi:hypothetical protein
MNELPNKQSSFFRFRLITLIVVIAALAVLFVAGMRAYEWYTSTPLSASVDAFNVLARTDAVGKHEPPLTEDEIVTAIETQLPTLKASHQVKAIFARIARTRRLPRGALLNSIPGYEPVAGKRYTVWWINLDVMTGPTSGYGLRIRETDNPVAAEGTGLLLKEKLD